MKNLIWVAFCKVLTKAIKFKDTGQRLASLLKEYCVVLQVTNITHNPPNPNLFEKLICFIRNSPNTTINKNCQELSHYYNNTN